MAIAVWCVETACENKITKNHLLTLGNIWIYLNFKIYKLKIDVLKIKSYNKNRFYHWFEYVNLFLDKKFYAYEEGSTRQNSI